VDFLLQADKLHKNKQIKRKRITFFIGELGSVKIGRTPFKKEGSPFRGSLLDCYIGN
jgi:hypothetical protein